MSSVIVLASCGACSKKKVVVSWEDLALQKIVDTEPVDPKVAGSKRHETDEERYERENYAVNEDDEEFWWCGV